MNRTVVLLVMVAFAFTSIGCANRAYFNSTVPGVVVKKKTADGFQEWGTTPFEREVGNTTFGKYLLSVEKDGQPVFSGKLPLKVSSGGVVLSIFTGIPVFFVLFDAHKYYCIDIAKQEIIPSKQPGQCGAP